MMTMWKVPSASDTNIQYTVRQVGNRLMCNCTGFHYRSDCWHIRTVQDGLPGGGGVSGMLLAAMQYADLGYHVIPCEPGGKRPLVPWLPFQLEKPTTTDLSIWWTKWPDANVALVLGRGIFAVDFDGGDVAEDMLARGGIWMPVDAPRSKTHNGFHVLLSSDAPVQDRVGLVRSDFEVGGLTEGGKPRVAQVDIRGRGIIVAPPSVHPSGDIYEWMTPIVAHPPAAPAKLIELMNQVEEPVSAVPLCHCGAKVSWRMVAGEDGVRSRKYLATCAEHSEE